MYILGMEFIDCTKNKHIKKRPYLLTVGVLFYGVLVSSFDSSLKSPKRFKTKKIPFDTKNVRKRLRYGVDRGWVSLLF